MVLASFDGRAPYFLGPSDYSIAMKHKRYKWQWGSTDEDKDIFDAKNNDGEYLHAERRTTLHPRLRQRKYHDRLWTVLGHEFIHGVHGDTAESKAGEARAQRLEETAGAMLHDFYHRFRSGLPKCSGKACGVDELKPRPRRNRD